MKGAREGNNRKVLEMLGGVSNRKVYLSMTAKRALHTSDTCMIRSSSSPAPRNLSSSTLILIISSFPGSSFPIMDTFDHFFPSVFEWDQKHVQLPPGLNAKPDTILNILHNYRLLVQRILWPQFTIKSRKLIRYAPLTTVFILGQNTAIRHPQRTVTCTSLDDGVSCLEELRGV